jgi:(R,R)-butanediol dehydrogenase/meso-butanediol dehydrogenase/diacetyl reductase
MNGTMRAAVSYGAGAPLVIERRPIPDCGPADLLIRIERCGICGSDLHAHDFEEARNEQGTIPGHEIAGTIVAKGDRVSTFSIGERIAVYPAVGCGTCTACERGNPILCPAAVWVSGGYAEFIRVPVAAAIRLPADLDPEHAALIEPLTVSLYGLKVGQLAKGERVLVLGAGSIALTAIYWARRMGAGKVVAMSRTPHRAELATAMGADGFVTYSADEQDRVRESLGGRPDVVVECIGAPGMLDKAIAHAGLYGRVVSLGLSAKPEAIVPAMAGMKGVSLYFPVGYAMDDFRATAEAIRGGSVDPAIMVSSVIPLEAVPERFKALQGAHSETKVHIAP